MNIPEHGFDLREYQKDIKCAFYSQKYEQLMVVVARRGGKTTVIFSECIVPALVGEVQKAIIIYPTLESGRKNFWENIENDGFRVIDHIPKELIRSKRDDKMSIELLNGSIIQVVGASNPDSLRGDNARIYWIDEAADVNTSSIIGIIEPIVRQNNGKIIFSGTPKIEGVGGESMRRRYEDCKKSPHKYACYVPATEFMSEEQLARARQEYIVENGNDFVFKQEYLLDWGQSASASYYGQIMSKKDNDGTIGSFPYLPDQPVYTAWDLGRSDSMVVLYFQYANGYPRIIDIDELEGSNIIATSRLVKSKPYVYGWHFLPHDGAVGSTNDGSTRLDTLHREGILNASLLRREGVGVGIGRVEHWLPKILMNRGTTKDFHRKIRVYKRKYNPKTGEYLGPDHSSQSHIADALRYMCTALDRYFNEKGECSLTLTSTQTRYDSDLFDVPLFSF